MTKKDFARPPHPDKVSGLEEIDGRSARATGRTVQFATVVSPEFKEWIKAEAARLGKSMAALLDDMRADYHEKWRLENALNTDMAEKNRESSSTPSPANGSRRRKGGR